MTSLRNIELKSFVKLHFGTDSYSWNVIIISPKLVHIINTI